MLGILRDQKGDTIIEVLISIAIASLVLVSSYVLTTRNVDTIQATQEHSEALQLAQGQIEFLRNGTPPGGATTGCYVVSTGVWTTGDTSNACNVDASGTHTGVQPVFKVDVTPPSVTPPLPAPQTADPPGVYDVLVTWPGLGTAAATTYNVNLYYYQS
ncbi:MAG TPA: hypothetical protein VMB52_05665 [Verrucomicrobiae bacterium]|nr:hypothetical protein [Verrucomicrobiae bacterium]